MNVRLVLVCSELNKHVLPLLGFGATNEVLLRLGYVVEELPFHRTAASFIAELAPEERV